jgi:hypothetical protein
MLKSCYRGERPGPDRSILHALIPSGSIIVLNSRFALSPLMSGAEPHSQNNRGERRTAMRVVRTASHAAPRNASAERL